MFLSEDTLMPTFMSDFIKNFVILFDDQDYPVTYPCEDVDRLGISSGSFTYISEAHGFKR